MLFFSRESNFANSLEKHFREYTTTATCMYVAFRDRGPSGFGRTDSFLKYFNSAMIRLRSVIHLLLLEHTARAFQLFEEFNFAIERLNREKLEIYNYIYIPAKKRLYGIHKGGLFIWFHMSVCKSEYPLGERNYTKYCNGFRVSSSQKEKKDIMSVECDKGNKH